MLFEGKQPPEISLNVNTPQNLSNNLLNNLLWPHQKCNDDNYLKQPNEQKTNREEKKNADSTMKVIRHALLLIAVLDCSICVHNISIKLQMNIKFLSLSLGHDHEFPSQKQKKPKTSLNNKIQAYNRECLDGMQQKTDMIGLLGENRFWNQVIRAEKPSNMRGKTQKQQQQIQSQKYWQTFKPDSPDQQSNPIRITSSSKILTTSWN